MGSENKERRFPSNIIHFPGDRGSNRFTFDSAWSKALVGGAIAYTVSSLMGDVPVLLAIKISEISGKSLGVEQLAELGNFYLGGKPLDIGFGVGAGLLTAGLPRTVKGLLHATEWVIKYEILRKNRPDYLP